MTESTVSSFMDSFKSRVQKILIFTLGKPNYLNIADLKYVFDRDTNQLQFKPSLQEQVYRESIQKNLSIYLGVGALSSVGMNLLMQKVSPKFSTASVGRLIMDLGIASICIGTGMYLSLNAVEPDLMKLKKLYFDNKDIDFIRYLRRQSEVYDISMENEVKRFMDQKEFDLWNATEGVELLSLVK